MPSIKGSAVTDVIKLNVMNMSWSFWCHAQGLLCITFMWFIPLRFVTRSFEAGMYIWLYDTYHVVDLPYDNPWVWLLALLGTDFCFYWAHRMSHGDSLSQILIYRNCMVKIIKFTACLGSQRVSWSYKWSVLKQLKKKKKKNILNNFFSSPEINFLWTAHFVHHSSEDYNLSTALRQPVLARYTAWVSVYALIFIIFITDTYNQFILIIVSVSFGPCYNVIVQYLSNENMHLYMWMVWIHNGSALSSNQYFPDVLYASAPHHSSRTLHSSYATQHSVSILDSYTGN